MKARVTVSFPVHIELDVDENKLDCDEYIEELRNQAKEEAKEDVFDISPFITNSDVDDLIE